MHHVQVEFAVLDSYTIDCIFKFFEIISEKLRTLEKKKESILHNPDREKELLEMLQ